MFYSSSALHVEREWSTVSVDKEWGAQEDVEGSESDIRDTVFISNQKPSFALSCTDPVLFAEFAPFDWCSDLICITFEERIVIGQLKKQDRNSGTEGGGEGKYINFLRTFVHIHGSPTCLCWNPATLSHAEPSKVCLSVCIGCKDHKLRVFSSNLGDKEHNVVLQIENASDHEEKKVLMPVEELHQRRADPFFEMKRAYKQAVRERTCKVLEGHTDFINTAMYHPEGHILATGSDDFTCRIWNVKNDYECQAVLNLHTMVMAVRFTVHCPDHFLVAVKSGKIHLFSLNSKRPLKTFYCEEEPLLMADWSLDSRDYLAAAVGDDLLWWDMSGSEASSSFPVEKRPTLLQRGQYVCFAPWSHKIVATFGGPEPQFRIKVFSLTELKDPLFSTTVKWRPWNLSWHKRVPILCAGVGKRLCFWELSHLRMLGE